MQQNPNFQTIPTYAELKVMLHSNFKIHVVKNFNKHNIYKVRMNIF